MKGLLVSWFKGLEFKELEFLGMGIWDKGSKVTDFGLGLSPWALIKASSYLNPEPGSISPKP